MSYRCSTCRNVVPKGEPRLLHVVKRPDGQTARELSVCERCHEVLSRGAKVADLTAAPEVEGDVEPISVRDASAAKVKILPPE